MDALAERVRQNEGREGPARPGSRARYVPSRRRDPLAVLYLRELRHGAPARSHVRRTFGAGSELDAYNAAFVLPELLFDVLVEAGLAAPFIPIFVRLRGQDTGAGGPIRPHDPDRRGGGDGRGLDHPLRLRRARPSTSSRPASPAAERELYVSLFRIMLVTQVLFAASLTLGQVLLAEQRYFWYADRAAALQRGDHRRDAPARRARSASTAPAVGAVLGAAIHLGSRFIGLRGSEFRPRLRSGVPDRIGARVRAAHAAASWSPAGRAVAFLFFTNVASGLAAGSLAIVNYARNFQSVPVSLVGVAFAVAAFPALSTAHAAGDRPNLPAPGRDEPRSASPC